MLKTIHSYWAYLLLIILVFVVINAILAIAKKREYSQKDLRIGLFAFIASHIQLLLGFAVYFSSPYFKMLTDNAGEVMKNSATRKLALEHPLTMVIAVALITIGWARHKKKTDSRAVFSTFLVFYGIALVLILSMIPWSDWLAF